MVMDRTGRSNECVTDWFNMRREACTAALKTKGKMVGIIDVIEKHHFSRAHTELTPVILLWPRRNLHLKLKINTKYEILFLLLLLLSLSLSNINSVDIIIIHIINILLYYFDIPVKV